MTGRKEIFKELHEASQGGMTFHDMSKIPVRGKCKITIYLKDGSQQTISDVYYVPDMKNNILSLCRFF